MTHYRGKLKQKQKQNKKHLLELRVRYTGSQSKNMRLKQGQKTTDRLVIHKTLQEEIKAVDTLRQTDTEGREQRLNTLGRKGNQTKVYHREGRVITGAGNMDRR